MKDPKGSGSDSASVSVSGADDSEGLRSSMSDVEAEEEENAEDDEDDEDEAEEDDRRCCCCVDGASWPLTPEASERDAVLLVPSFFGEAPVRSA